HLLTLSPPLALPLPLFQLSRSPLSPLPLRCPLGRFRLRLSLPVRSPRPPRLHVLVTRLSLCFLPVRLSPLRPLSLSLRSLSHSLLQSPLFLLASLSYPRSLLVALPLSLALPLPLFQLSRSPLSPLRLRCPLGRFRLRLSLPVRSQGSPRLHVLVNRLSLCFLPVRLSPLRPLSLSLRSLSHSLLQSPLFLLA